MDQDAALKKIGIGSGMVALGMMGGVFLYYLFKVLAARFLRPESYGVFVQALAIVQSASVVALLGLHKTVPRSISYGKGSEKSSSLSKSVVTSLIIFLPTAAVFTVLIYFSSDFVSSMLSEPQLSEPLKILSFAVLPMGLLSLIKSFFRGNQNAKEKILIDDVVDPVVMLSSGLVLFWAGFGIEGAVAATLIATSAASIFGLYRFLSKNPVSFDKDSFVPKSLLSFSWPLFFVAVFTIFGQWYGVILLGLLMDSTAAGIYEIALSVAGTLVLFLTTVSYMFMPVVSELYGKDKLTEITSIYSTSTRWIFTALLPLFAVMSIFPQEILFLMFGAQYAEGGSLLAIMAAGFFFSVTIGPGEMVLLSTGRTKQYMLSIGSMVVIGSLLCLVLIPSYGLIGAAIATSAGNVVGNLFILVFVKKELGDHPYNKRYLKPIFSILLASTFVLFLRTKANSILLDMFLASILIATYIITLYKSGLYEEETKLLETIFEKYSDL